MRIDGSPTQAYHREHYGADYNYYNFSAAFNRESKKWDPDKMASIFRDAGARYVVLTSKHHEGFTLWPSATPNPTLPLDRQHAARDLVGELTTAVTNHGMRMGLYYSGGYDWTFVPGPIRTAELSDGQAPERGIRQVRFCADSRTGSPRYHPAVLWGDIDWPKTGNALQVETDYYNAIPDGVIDDRFGIKHADFKSPEYQKLDKISEKKWEECRGLGRSFATTAPKAKRNHTAGRADFASGRHREQERQPAAGRRTGSRWDDTASADGTVEGARGVAQAKRRSEARYDAPDSGGGEVSRGRRPALYSQGKRTCTSRSWENRRRIPLRCSMCRRSRA
jgi:alpha-L-fucosidase